jgi:hypothetical protein
MSSGASLSESASCSVIVRSTAAAAMTTPVVWLGWLLKKNGHSLPSGDGVITRDSSAMKERPVMYLADVGVNFFPGLDGVADGALS